MHFFTPDQISDWKDVLVVQPVLHHLGVDSCTLLNQQKEKPHEARLNTGDLSKAMEKLGTGSLMILDKLQGRSIVNYEMRFEEDNNKTNIDYKQSFLTRDLIQPRLNISQVRFEVDKFRILSLIDSVDYDQYENIIFAVQQILQSAQ